MFLVVGEKDCEITDVVKAIFKSSVSCQLDNKWTEVARGLGVAKTCRDKWASKKTLDLMGIQTIMENILIEWRSLRSNNASIHELLTVLTELDLNDIVQCLKREFKIEDVTNSNGIDTVDESSSASESRLQLHLEYYIVDLVDRADLNDGLLSKIEAESILSHDEIKFMKSIFNSEDQSRMFWRMIIEKVGDKKHVYDKLIQAFASDAQNHRKGVTCILNRYYD